MTKDERQQKTPYFTKLKAYTESKPISLDVPGHKLGKINNELLEYTGPNIFKLDANAPKGLDNLSKPKGVIKEAQELMAEAFGADCAYFLTNGTTQGILAVMMSVCRANQKILLPRNVHKSVINGLILSGAIPVFMKPNIDNNLGIANGVSLETAKNAILENPEAKAIFLINPTYFGVVSDLTEIVKLAHKHDMKVIVDEAHGGHFYFSNKLPLGAIEAEADLSIVSIHKTVGSMTQSSVILTKGKRVDHNRLEATLNILNSTSPSGLLMASLDVARKTMYFEGTKKLDKLVKMTKDARNKINQIPGIEAITKDYFIKKGEYDSDESRIIVKVSDLGITGFDAYNELRDIYNVQLELAETHLILAVLTIGTTEEDLDKFVDALSKISEKHLKENREPIHQKLTYNEPIYYMRPREAYHSYKKYVRLKDATNEVAAESIMVYPPGIPIVIPGEVISEEIINDLLMYKKLGSTILSDSDGELIKVVDLEKSGQEED
ncbi:MAG: aminotransferase class I/II-fold pyridoxal phosphate-dependent enzyme [Acholeplasmataceae bacterium]|jgi:arginine decarboxylase